MYRTGKLFRGSSTMFVLFPLFIYVVTTTLLLAVEGSQTSPSQRQTKEAQKIIGRFLRHEAGATWLSELVKKNSSPLTTQDLMSAISRATRKGGRVWKAAEILSEGLKLQEINGTSSDAVTGHNENWKDLIANIEMEDDIICLYRKNTNETTKKADDWKQFLRTVSPGYTVHLAIDTGNKYVICLKKIDVPETTMEEHASTQEIPTTTLTSVSFNESAAEKTSQSSMEREKNTSISTMDLKTETKKVKTDFALGKSDESCENCNTEENTDDESYIDDEDEDDDDDDDYDLDYEESLENENRLYNYSRRMEDDLSVKSNDIMNSGSKLHRSMGDRGYSSRTQDRPRFSVSPPRTSERFDPQIAHSPECKRPIILVVPNGNVMSAYQPQLPIGIPFYQNFRPNLPWVPQNSMTFSKVLGSPYNNLQNNLPNLIRPQNQGNNIIKYDIPAHKGINGPVIGQKTYFPHETSAGKTQGVRSFVKPTPKRIQTTRNALGSQLPDMKSQVRDDVQGRFIFMRNGTYPILNYFPQRIESSVSKIQNNSPDQLRAPTRNILLPKSSEQTNQMRYDFLSRMAQPRNEYRVPQLIKYPVDSRLPSPVPILRPQQMVPSSVQKPIVPLYQPLVYDRSRLPQSPIVNEGLPVRPPPTLIQNVNRIDLRLTGLLKSIKNQPQVPCTMFNPMKNYPVGNNFVQRMAPVMKPSNFNVPCSNTAKRFDGRCAVNHFSYPVLICHNPLNCPAVGYRNYPISCPSPCDRPIKLQILINGKIQEPLSVSVLADPGQKLEIVGSGTATQPYGSRSLTGGVSERKKFYDQDNIKPEVAERMDEGEEEKEDSPSLRYKFVNSDNMEDEEDSPKRNGIKTTSAKSEIESNEAQEIVDRFLPDTIETSSSLEANGPVTTTTSSTIIAV